MIWRLFYSNETVKCSWSDSASSSGDVVHVFMSLFSETADAEVTASITRFSMCVCSKWNHSALYGKFHYMTAFRPHFPHRGHHGLYWGVLQLQQRLLLLYLWETTDAWSLRQLQLACAFGVRLPSVFRVDWSDSWLSTYQMSGGRRLLSEIERSPHSHRVLSSDRLHRAK